jgi:hypothetical protein
MPTLRDIALLRLRNQQLIGKGFGSAAEAVGWFGAVQSQDYAGARWALGQRLKPSAASDRDIERAFDLGEILRTHVMRPTWHFVLPADIRWLLALTAPRVRALMRLYDAKLELDRAILDRSQELLSAALHGGKHLTRNELAGLLAKAGIVASGQRLGHIMMHAELDALICSGPRRGKQFTYALLSERAPDASGPKNPSLTREQALTELTLRYFTSHGPALPQDFAWWSGLTREDTRRGLELAGDALSELVVDGRAYHYAGSARPPKLAEPTVHLLPNYDEHLISYRERSATIAREYVASLSRNETVLANHLITLDGQVIGGWKRKGTQPDAAIETTLLIKLNTAQRQALAAAEARLRAFLSQ